MLWVRIQLGVHGLQLSEQEMLNRQLRPVVEVAETRMLEGAERRNLYRKPILSLGKL